MTNAAKSDEPKSNMKYLGHGYYLCRTQAGFRRAVKEFNRNYASDFEGQWNPKTQTYGPRPAKEVRGYPKSYPSLVHISDESVGSCYSFTAASCTPISWARAAILPFIFRFLRSDRPDQKDFT